VNGSELACSMLVPVKVPFGHVSVTVTASLPDGSAAAGAARARAAATARREVVRRFIRSNLTM
jgi:hypothetical protein